MRKAPAAVMFVAMWGGWVLSAAAQTPEADARRAQLQAEENERNRQIQLDNYQAREREAARERENQAKIYGSAGQASTPAAQAQTAQDQAWYAGQAQRTRDTMAVLRAMPVVPAARNPILGKWVTEAGQRPAAKFDDLFGQLAQLGSLACRAMFSDGVVNFKPGEFSLDDSAGDESLGPVTYRGRGSMVAILPAKGINALVFEVESKDRLVELRTSSEEEACVLTRVPMTTTYATRPRPGRAVPAARPGAPAARPGAPAADVAVRPAAPSAAAPRSAAGAALRASIDPRSLLGQGVALHSSGFEFQDALAKLLQAAKATPNDARVHAYLADTYRRLSLRAESSAAEARARQLDPNVMEIFK